MAKASSRSHFASRTANAIRRQASEGLRDYYENDSSEGIDTYSESEERYSIDDAKGLVCDVVGLVNSFSPSLFCQSELISQASDYGMINNALGGDQFAAHKKFFEQIQNESVHSSQSDADKQFVETLTLQIENTGKILGDYTLISEEEYGQTMATVDAIFGTRISGPDAEDIQRLKLPSGPHQLDGLRKSLLYRAYIEDNLNRRTIRNGAAIDGSVIDQGSMDAYHKRVETLNGVTHSDVAKRLNALYTAKLLESSFVSLRKSLQKQTINALKYKELRGR